MRHEEAHELLPWLRTGGLSAGERRALEDHLQGCAPCAEEMKRLDLLREAVEEVGAEEPQPHADLLARALERLPGQSAPRAGFLAGGPDRLRETWTAFWQPLAPPVRLAFALQLALIVALSAGWYASSRPQPGIVTLGGSPVTAKGERALLLVAFRPEAAEGDVRASVVAVGGRIVDGPSPAGFYTVAVPLAPDRAPQIDALLSRLRRNPAVLYAERAP